MFEIWFGQFNTIDGAVQEEGPYVGIFEGDADEPDGVGVYILAEPVGGASPELCAATIEAIAGAFDAPRQALTASLLRALNAGNAYVLRHYPVEGSPDFGVGVTVLAIRRGEGYVAQAGPSLACVRGGGATRILQPAGEAAARPLGSDARITPSFARLEIQPGDSAVLLFSAGEELIGVRRLAQIVTQPPEHALPDLFLRARGEPDFAALYLSVVGERRPSAAPSTDLPVPRGVARQSPAAAVAQPAAGNVETLVVESDDPLAERRNGHSVNGTSTVRTVIPRRTPMGSMAPSALPITRRHIAIAGAVAGLALLLLLVLPSLARQGKSEKFTQLLRGADEAIAAAEKETDVARRRDLLNRAQSTVDEARTLRTVAPASLAGLEERLSAQVAEIDGVRELADLVQVADLAAPGLAAPSATQLALGPSIYLLDATVGKVVALPKQGDSKPVTVFEEGRPAGANRTGRARMMTWWAAEGGRPGALLVLDDQRRLYAVDARGDIRPIALGETDSWKSDTAMAMGTSNLYVLDAAGNQVWRYTLNAGGFPGAPEPLLNARAVIKDASGISVTAGPVITTPDGRMLRIVDGREQLMQPVALDRPLLAPAPPQTNAGDGLTYVADRGNQRVVRLSPDGTFRGQLTHHRLAGLQAIALDEAEGTLYAIAGQTLVKATIPK